MKKIVLLLLPGQTTAVGVDLNFQQNDFFKPPLDVMLNTTINASFRY